MVILGEGDLDLARLARLHALELLGEARDEPGSGDLDIHVRAGAALEHLTLDLAGEIDGQHLALLGAAILFHGHEAALAGGDLAERLVERFVGGGGLEPGELDAGEIGHRDLGQELELELELEILVLGLGRAHEIDLGLGGGAQATIGEELAGGFADALFQHLGGDGVAVALLDHAHRHLAGAEARDAQGLAELGEARGALALDIDGGHDHGEAALQAFGQRLGNLHRPGNPQKSTDWCGRRDLNPHGLRHQNLNLACLPIPPRPLGT